MNIKSFAVAAIGASTIIASGAANAALVNLGPGSFTAAASVITFSEQPFGTVDPVYSVGGNTISFGTNFVGQSVTAGSPRTLTGSPTGGSLSLVQDGGTRIVGDGSNPTSPVLSGSPTFNGPISFLFSTPVAAVGLDGGYFNAIGGTTIEAFDVNGASLGSIVNSALGIEFYGLFDTSGSNIAGVSFYITGNEPAGFAIDNLTFGNANVVRHVPEPASLALVGLGIGGLIARRRKST